MRYLFALLVALFSFSAPAAPVENKPALWKLSDADTTIWLFGTIHLLGPDHRWFHGPVAKAFADAEELTIETRIPDPAAVQAMVQRRAMDGRTLAERLPPALHGRVMAQLESYGLPSAQFEGFEPWYVALTLELVAYQRMGMASGTGVEATLLTDAARDGKQVEAFEGFEEQISYFDTMSEELQVALLRSTLDDLGEASGKIGALVRAWSRGDIGELARMMNEGFEEMPELAEILLDRRNARWADAIAARMERPGTVFVAVGAGHLGGKDNVRALLERKGFDVKRVQ